MIWLLLFAAITMTCAHIYFPRGESLTMTDAASRSGYSRGASYWLQKMRLGGPDNNLMPNGKLGIPTPTRDCVLSWNDFLTHVAGKTYINVYGINNHEEIFVPKTFKWKVRWTFNGTLVNRAGSNWTDYLISDNPSEKFIFHICYDPSQNVANKCPISETLLVVRDRRPNVDVDPADGIPDVDLAMTNTDWSRIDRKSRSSIGEGLVNTDAVGWEWYWKGPESHLP